MYISPVYLLKSTCSSIGLPGSVYLLNNFDLKEFGLAKLPHGFNIFLLIGLDITAL